MTNSTVDPVFLSSVGQMLDTRGEILVETCYSYAAGSHDFALLNSLSSFQDLLRTLSARTLVYLYRQYDLPLRGVVSEGLIQSALERLPDDVQYLIVYLQPRNEWRLAAEYEKAGGWLSSFQDCQGHVELAEELRDNLGEPVAIGFEPEWVGRPDNILQAIVPDADGSVHFGIY